MGRASRRKRQRPRKPFDLKAWLTRRAEFAAKIRELFHGMR